MLNLDGSANSRRLRRARASFVSGFRLPRRAPPHSRLLLTARPRARYRGCPCDNRHIRGVPECFVFFPHLFFFTIRLLLIQLRIFRVVFSMLSLYPVQRSPGPSHDSSAALVLKRVFGRRLKVRLQCSVIRRPRLTCASAAELPQADTYRLPLHTANKNFFSLEISFCRLGNGNRR